MSTSEAPAMVFDQDVGTESGRKMRIDAPHEGSSTGNEATAASNDLCHAEGTALNDSMAGNQPILELEEPTAEMISAVAGENLDVRREQLQLQVAQLAGHLRERLRSLDHREATLNARVAQLESDLR